MFVVVLVVDVDDDVDVIDDDDVNDDDDDDDLFCRWLISFLLITSSINALRCRFEKNRLLNYFTLFILHYYLHYVIIIIY